MRKFTKVTSVLALSLLVGCNSTSSPATGSSASPSSNPNAATFSGTALGPGTVFGSGSSSSLVPLSNTTLQVIDPATGSAMGQAVTNASGQYTVSVTPTRTQGLHTQQAGTGTQNVCACIINNPGSRAGNTLNLIGISCTPLGGTATGSDVTPGTTAAANAMAQTLGLEKVPFDVTNGPAFAAALQALKSNLPDIIASGRKLDTDPTFTSAADASQALQAMQNLAANLAQQAASIAGGVAGSDQSANNVLLAFGNFMPRLKDQFVPGTAPDVNGLAQNLGNLVNGFKQAVQQTMVSQIANRPFTLPPGIAQKVFVPPPAPFMRIGSVNLKQAGDGSFTGTFPSLGLNLPPQLAGVVKSSTDPTGNIITTSFSPPVPLVGAYGGGTPVITQTVTMDPATGTTTLAMTSTGLPANFALPEFPQIKLTIAGKNSNPSVSFTVTQTQTTPGGTTTQTMTATGQLNATGTVIAAPFNQITITGSGDAFKEIRLASQKGLPFVLRFERQSGSGVSDISGTWVVTETLPSDQALPADLLQAGQPGDAFTKLLGALQPLTNPVAGIKVPDFAAGIFTLPSGLPTPPVLLLGADPQAYCQQFQQQFTPPLKQAGITEALIQLAFNRCPAAIQQALAAQTGQK